MRVRSRLLRRAKTARGEQVALGQEDCRTRTRSVRRLAHQLQRVAQRQGEQAAEELQEAYAKLSRIAEQSRAQASQVRDALRARGAAAAPRVVEGSAHFLPLVEQAMAQATRRVVRGEAVPSAAKVPSLFEPQTQVIRRHTAGQPTEFGRQLLDAVEGGLISRYQCLRAGGLAQPQLRRSRAAHPQRFARAPDVLSGDRGLYAPEHDALARQAGGKHVVRPKTGRRSRERQQHERQRWFRRGFRFRAGIEGRIHAVGLAPSGSRT